MKFWKENGVRIGIGTVFSFICAVVAELSYGNSVVTFFVCVVSGAGFQFAWELACLSPEE